MTDLAKRISMDFNNKKRKGGVALASRRLGRVEKGQPLILGANKMEGGYNFAVEASEDSEVSLLLYKKRGAAAPVEIVFPKDFHTGRVWINIPTRISKIILSNIIALLTDGKTIRYESAKKESVSPVKNSNQNT